MGKQTHAAVNEDTVMKLRDEEGFGTTYLARGLVRVKTFESQSLNTSRNVTQRRNPLAYPHCILPLGTATALTPLVTTARDSQGSRGGGVRTGAGDRETQNVLFHATFLTQIYHHHNQTYCTL